MYTNVVGMSKEKLFDIEVIEYSQNLFLIFLKYKTETAKQGRDSCLKKINVT